MSTNLNDLPFDKLAPTNSEYLKQDDVGTVGMVVTVKGFTRADLDGNDGKETKTIIHFLENLKPMVLGPTNALLLQQAVGGMLAKDAIGRQILVYADPTVMFGHKRTGGLRIKSAPAGLPGHLPNPARPFINPPGFEARQVDEAPAKEVGAGDWTQEVPF